MMGEGKKLFLLVLRLIVEISKSISACKRVERETQ